MISIRRDCETLLASPNNPPSPEITLLCQAIEAVQVSLLSAANKITAVNRLPPEVLQQIFAMLPLCVQDIDRKVPLRLGSADTIAEVCTYWRDVAIGAPFLWTHIDLTVGSNFRSLHQRSAILFERSRGLPIHLHISDPNKVMHSCHESQVLDLTKIIAQHVNRIDSLDVHSRFHPQCLIRPVHAFWRNNGVIGSTKALSIRQPGSNKNVLLDRTPQAASGLKLREHDDELLHSLRTLRLQNAHFPWDSPAYRDLVDLRLDFTGSTAATVSQSSLADIFTSSPRLATLKLGNLTITQTLNWDESMSCELDCLQVLNVLGMASDSLSLLLPMISPAQGSGSLSVGMPVHTGNKFTEVLGAFFSRSHVTTLHLAQQNTSNDITHIMPLLNHIPSLERLSIQCSTPGQCTLPGTYDPVPGASEMKRPIDLDELYMVSKPVNLQQIQPFISEYGVQNLFLVGCEFYVESSLVTFEEFRNLLIQAFPDINCVLLLKDPVFNWPCCTIFSD
ncbi:hypothetical protein BDV93DRAFT_587830 [Ceratobasidium sp. AG-I]|nr:hypothetical protein BDV93DRAFT_587830 [Ceratobasidium sp. AG-I]